MIGALFSYRVGCAQTAKRPRSNDNDVDMTKSINEVGDGCSCAVVLARPLNLLEMPERHIRLGFAAMLPSPEIATGQGQNERNFEKSAFVL